MSGDEARPSPTSLRGIAHPLRLRMLALLRESGPATATGLAERVGQSTGATSYHLRQLAHYGFIVEDVDRGVGRERWWRAAHQRTVLDGDVGRQAPAETEAYMRSVAALYADRTDRWLGELPSLPDEWQDASTLSDWRLRLTPDEAKGLREEIFALAERYRRDPGPDPAARPDGAERVVLQMQLMPFVRTAGEEE
jgi:DNA-binding transcriptional ArsR family regulator